MALGDFLDWGSGCGPDRLLLGCLRSTQMPCNLTYGRAAAAATVAALAAHALSALEGLLHLRFPSWGCMLWALRFFGLAWGLCCWVCAWSCCEGRVSTPSSCMKSLPSSSSESPPLRLPLSLFGDQSGVVSFIEGSTILIPSGTQLADFIWVCPRGTLVQPCLSTRPMIHAYTIMSWNLEKFSEIPA